MSREQESEKANLQKNLDRAESWEQNCGMPLPACANQCCISVNFPSPLSIQLLLKRPITAQTTSHAATERNALASGGPRFPPVETMEAALDLELLFRVHAWARLTKAKSKAMQKGHTISFFLSQRNTPQYYVISRCTSCKSLLEVFWKWLESSFEFNTSGATFNDEMFNYWLNYWQIFTLLRNNHRPSNPPCQQPRCSCGRYPTGRISVQFTWRFEKMATQTHFLPRRLSRPEVQRLFRLQFLQMAHYEIMTTFVT